MPEDRVSRDHKNCAFPNGNDQSRSGVTHSLPTPLQQSVSTTDEGTHSFSSSTSRQTGNPYIGMTADSLRCQWQGRTAKMKRANKDLPTGSNEGIENTMSEIGDTLFFFSRTPNKRSPDHRPGTSKTCKKRQLSRT